MKPETRERLNNWGCLLSLVVLIAAAVAAFLGRPAWLLPAVPIILVSFLFWLSSESARRKAVQQQELEALAEAFRDFDGTVPALESMPAMGWPHFTLTFDSKETRDLAEAQGRIASFKAEIQKLYGHIGRGERFDVDRAVFATYEWRFNFDHLEHQFPDLAPPEKSIWSRINYWAAVITGIGTVLGAISVGYLAHLGIWSWLLIAIYLVSVFYVVTFVVFTYGTKWLQVLWLITLTLFLLGLTAALFNRNQYPGQPPANTGDSSSTTQSP